MKPTPYWQSASPRKLGENDLRAELERLEGLLAAGELSTLNGQRLSSVRRQLRELEELRRDKETYQAPIRQW